MSDGFLLETLRGKDLSFQVQQLRTLLAEAIHRAEVAEADGQALRQQQILLKEHLKKAQAEQAQPSADEHTKQLERVIQFLRERYEGIQLEVDQLRRERIEMEGSLQKMASLHEEKQQIQDQLRESEQRLAEWHEKVVAVVEEREQLAEALRAKQIEQEELESELRNSKQHLGKKVREVALVSQQVEEQRNQIAELQKNLSASSSKISELHHVLESYSQQDKRFQEQLKEVSKSAELQAARWEEKYFQIHEKWQESENRCKELKVFEERCSQMQSLLMNVGTVLGSTVQQNPIPTSSKLHPLPAQETPENMMATSEQVTLFEISAEPQKRYRQTLFD